MLPHRRSVTDGEASFSPLRKKRNKPAKQQEQTSERKHRVFSDRGSRSNRHQRASANTMPLPSSSMLDQRGIYTHAPRLPTPIPRQPHAPEMLWEWKEPYIQIDFRSGEY